MSAPTSQFLLSLTSTDGDLGGAEVVEALALELRAELSDAAAQRIDQVTTGTAPEGARGLEILGICTFLITAVQTGEALSKVVAAVPRR